MKIGQSAGKSWAYVTGVYLGDGCVTTQPGRPGKVWLVFRLNSIDQDFIDATKAALEDVTDSKVSFTSYWSPKSTAANIALRCGDQELCKRLRLETNDKQKLPDWIWSASQDERLAFIIGLMDSEGYVCMSKTGLYIGFKSTDPWFYDFIRLLNSAGIEVGKVGVEKPIKAHFRIPRRFTFRRKSWIDSGAKFNIMRKQRRLDDWIAAQLTSETNTRDAA